jgi:hypothetical protein
MEACLSRETPWLGPLRDQGLRVGPLWKGSDLQNGPGTYKEALTYIKIAIFKENYPEDTLRMIKITSLKNWEGCFVRLQKENCHT